MSTSTKQSINTEGQIREVVDKWLAAVRMQDADELSSLYSADAVLFDVADQPAAKGAAALRKRIEEWLGRFSGPIKMELRELKITAGEDVAFCHMYGRMNGTTKDGTFNDEWIRATVGFKKSHGRWLATHEHASVPIDMITGKANLHRSP